MFAVLLCFAWSAVLLCMQAAPLREKLSFSTPPGAIIHHGADALLSNPSIPDQALSTPAAQEQTLYFAETAGAVSGSVLPDSPLIDTQKGLMYSDNDPVFYRELLDMFTQEVPLSLEKLSTALSEGNTALYTTLVHGLKNNARSIGADTAADICLIAERTARSGDLEKLAELHNKVCSIIIETARSTEL